MVLSRPDIFLALREGRIRFEPAPAPDQVTQVAVDLTLGRKFTRAARKPGYLPAIHVDPSLWASQDLWETIESDTFRLMPGAFVLVHTAERVTLPPDLVGLVEGRSSFAPGTITLELFNFSQVPVDLRAGIDRPAQLMFLQVTSPLDAHELYGADAGDVFQGQDAPLPQSRRKPRKRTSSGSREEGLHP